MLPLRLFLLHYYAYAHKQKDTQIFFNNIFSALIVLL